MPFIFGGIGGRFELLVDFDSSEFEAEAKERWGQTDEYRESSRRTKNYTTEDWARINEEGSAIDLAIAALMDEGVSAEDPRAMDAVDRAREFIDRWFYPCSREMHAGLGQMYISDSRFAERYEIIRFGMAQYMADATAANAKGD